MKDRLFHRAVVFADVPVEGHFILLDEFQLFHDSTLPGPGSYNGHHPLVLEHYYEAPELLINKLLNREVLTNSENDEVTHCQNVHFNRILNQLSVFTPYHFFAYDKKNKAQSHSWFIDLLGRKSPEHPELDYSSFWGSKMYSYSPQSSAKAEFSELQTKPVRLAPRDIIKPGYIFAPVLFPNDIFLLFNKYSLAEAIARDALDNACTLFVNGLQLWEISYSLSCLAFVSGIETLVMYENRDVSNEICPTCKQTKFKVVRKFKDFLIKYGGKDLKKKEMDEFYNMRSSIAHGGILLSGDIFFSRTESEAKETDTLRKLIDITRVCTRNWLIAQSSN